MRNRPHSLYMTALIRNYVFLLIISSLLNIVALACIYSVFNNTDYNEFIILLAIFVSIMGYCSFISIVKIVYPARMALTDEGIDLIINKKSTFIRWEEYSGMRGGPNYILEFRSKGGLNKSVIIGMWPYNPELFIYEFTKNIGKTTIVRSTAREQVSGAPMFIISLFFIIISLGVAWLSLS